jgi:hypothetical protein
MLFLLLAAASQSIVWVQLELDFTFPDSFELLYAKSCSELVFVYWYTGQYRVWVCMREVERWTGGTSTSLSIID